MLDGEGQTDGASEEGNQEPETYTKEDIDRIAEERVKAATSTTHKQLDLTKKELEALRAERDDLETKFSSLNSEVETYKKASSFDDTESFAKWQAERRQEIEQAQKELGRKAMDITRAELAAQYNVPRDLLSSARTEAEMYRRVLEFTKEAPSDSPNDTPPPPPQPKPNVGGAGNPTPRTDAKGVAKIGQGLSEDPAWNAFFDSFQR